MESKKGRVVCVISVGEGDSVVCVISVGERVTEQIINFIVCSFSADAKKEGGGKESSNWRKKRSTIGGVAFIHWIILAGLGCKQVAFNSAWSSSGWGSSASV